MSTRQHYRDWSKFRKTMSRDDVAEFERQRLAVWRNLPFVKAVEFEHYPEEGGEVMTIEYVDGHDHGKRNLLFWEASRQLQTEWMERKA